MLSLECNRSASSCRHQHSEERHLGWAVGLGLDHIVLEEDLVLVGGRPDIEVDLAGQEVPVTGNSQQKYS